VTGCQGTYPTFRKHHTRLLRKFEEDLRQTDYEINVGLMQEKHAFSTEKAERPLKGCQVFADGEEQCMA